MTVRSGKRLSCVLPCRPFGAEFGELTCAPQRALNTVGFSSAEQLSLFSIIATILHLGQLTLSVSGTSTAHLSSRTALEKAAFLLGVSPDSLHNALLRPKVKAGREWVTQARTRDQVVDEIGALSKSLYEKNFGALVDRINRSLEGGAVLGPQGKKTFIGVLDIAGFEIFETNGFEQLCINLTNEVRPSARVVRAPS